MMTSVAVFLIAYLWLTGGVITAYTFHKEVGCSQSGVVIVITLWPLILAATFLNFVIKSMWAACLYLWGKA